MAGFGKLILLGEHAAVYGSPAVGIALPCRTRVIFEPDSAESPTFPGMSEKDAAVLLSLLKCAKDEIQDSIAVNGRWTVESDVPRSGGFGSSAALCVAVAQILLRCKVVGYDREVHRLANRLERTFHGRPSGLDTGLSSQPELCAWYPKRDDVPEPVTLNIPPLHLVYGALPRVMNTAGSVGEIKRRLESGDTETLSLLQEIGRITAAFIRLGKRSSADARNFFSEAVDMIRRTQALLKALGLSTNELDLLLTIANEGGAATGKLSGGGMGGAFFLLVPDSRTQEQLLESLPERLIRASVLLSEPLKAIIVGER